MKRLYLRDRALRASAWVLVGLAYAADWVELRARDAAMGCAQAAAACAAAVTTEYNARLEAARFARLKKEREELHQRV